MALDTGLKEIERGAEAETERRRKNPAETKIEMRKRKNPRLRGTMMKKRKAMQVLTVTKVLVQRNLLNLCLCLTLAATHLTKKKRAARPQALTVTPHLL